MRIGLVVPHLFMHQDILPDVIFAPAKLALSLAKGLKESDVSVILFSPGPVQTKATNITADMSLFDNELKQRGYGYIELLKKHPVLFVSMARQVQSELIAKAYTMANDDELDLIHIYTNEEDIALPFAQLCRKPVVFTHHDPFNLLIRYKSVFPKYKHLNWLSMSYAQRNSMPKDTNWIGNIYHGIEKDMFRPNFDKTENYIAYLGRIIEPKGLHLAIKAVKKYNRSANQKLVLKIAGKHYSGHQKDTYWQRMIQPQIDRKEIVYLGYLGDVKARQQLLGGAKALIVPSIFEEPFGMVMIESLACGTPVIGLNSGAIPEVITNNKTGLIVKKYSSEPKTIAGICDALGQIDSINKRVCRQEFESRFTLDKMVAEHKKIYQQLSL